MGNLDVHYSSGVGNHFFYLLAEGSGAKTIGGRSHNSPTCNGSTVTGIGRDVAVEDLVSRTDDVHDVDDQLHAARATPRSRRPRTCTARPRRSAPQSSTRGTQSRCRSERESCGGTTPPPTGNLLLNPGFESGNVNWTASSGVIATGGTAAATGAYIAWLDGYGTTHTDTLSQTVAIPAGKSAASLSFYLNVTSGETTTTTAYDTLRVQVISGGTTTYPGDVLQRQQGHGVRPAHGQPEQLHRPDRHDQVPGRGGLLLATSFRIDDTSLATS